MEQDDRLQISAETIHTLADKGLIDAQSYAYALRWLGIVPNASRWQRWINIALLVLGVGFVLAGIIFFFAFNWNELPKFGKLALVQSLVVGAAAIAFWRGLKDVVGQAALTAAAVLIGIVLAVYGQIYQTGADSYQLFVWWAILSAGWVFISGFKPLWLGWVALLQFAFFSFWTQRMSENYSQMFLILFGINVLGLLLWELLWPDLRYGARLLMLGAMGFVLFPTLAFITEDFSVPDEPLVVLLPILYTCFTLACLRIYRRRQDLAPLAACGLSIIVLSVTLFVQIADFDNGLVVLLTGVLVLGLSALMGRWLQRTTQRWEGVSHVS